MTLLTKEQREAIALRAEARESIWIDSDTAMARHYRTDISALLSHIAEMEKRVAELEGALRPFADKAAKWEANHPIRVGSREHSHSTRVTHRLGDFRRARDVLEGADLKGASHEQG